MAVISRYKSLGLWILFNLILHIEAFYNKRIILNEC